MGQILGMLRPVGGCSLVSYRGYCPVFVTALPFRRGTGWGGGARIYRWRGRAALAWPTPCRASGSTPALCPLDPLPLQDRGELDPEGGDAGDQRGEREQREPRREAEAQTIRARDR